MSTVRKGDRVYAHFFDAGYAFLWKSGTVVEVFGHGSSDDYAKIRLDRPHAGDMWSTRLLTALRPFDVVEMLADLAPEEESLRGCREGTRRPEEGPGALP